MGDFVNFSVHIVYLCIGLIAGIGIGIFSRVGAKIAGDAAKDIEDEVSRHVHHG